MKNREKIYESITQAAISVDHQNPQPSTSKKYLNDVMITDENTESTHTDLHCDDFSDDLVIDENDLDEIDKLDQLKVPESLIPSITTTRNEKIVTTNDNRQIPPTYSTKKPPVSVFSTEKEKKPPLKRMKKEKPKTHTNEQFSECLSTNSSFQNSSIKYENCVFHGNIINHFYNPDADHENSEKKKMLKKNC